MVQAKFQYISFHSTISAEIVLMQEEKDRERKMPHEPQRLTDRLASEEVKNTLEARRKSYEKSVALYRVFTFVILVGAVALPSFGMFLALSKVESETIKIMAFVIGGIGGLLGGVLLIQFFDERQRKRQIEAIRMSRTL